MAAGRTPKEIVAFIEKEKVEVVDLRAYGLGRHRQLDDAPFGGGPGMVMMVEPLAAALEPLAGTHRVLLTPAMIQVNVLFRGSRVAVEPPDPHQMQHGLNRPTCRQPLKGITDAIPAAEEDQTLSAHVAQGRRRPGGMGEAETRRGRRATVVNGRRLRMGCLAG